MIAARRAAEIESNNPKALAYLAKQLAKHNIDEKDMNFRKDVAVINRFLLQIDADRCKARLGRRGEVPSPSAHTGNCRWLGLGASLAPLPARNQNALRELFEIEVFRFLRKKGLPSRERMEMILSWRHSGFNVHIAEAIPASGKESLTRIARYLLRAPVILSRISYSREQGTVRIRLVYPDQAIGLVSCGFLHAQAPYDPPGKFPAPKITPIMTNHGAAPGQNARYPLVCH